MNYDLWAIARLKQCADYYPATVLSENDTWQDRELAHAMIERASKWPIWVMYSDTWKTKCWYQCN